MSKLEDLRDLIIYQRKNNENISVEVLYDNEDFLLTQKSMSKLFNVEVNTINYHLKEIFKTNESNEESVIRKIRKTAEEKEYNEFNKHQKITSDFDELLIEAKIKKIKKWTKDFYSVIRIGVTWIKVKY